MIKYIIHQFSEKKMFLFLIWGWSGDKIIAKIIFSISFLFILNYFRKYWIDMLDFLLIQFIFNIHS